ncbi:MAG: biopolymer transporter ExbD, partial [Planctomycetota bacterium]
MKFKKCNTDILEADLTPMIDMTFNLIAFFMFTINFADAERIEQIML